MSLKFLCNTAAVVANGFGMGTGSVQSGTLYDLMMGPRSSMVRFASSTLPIWVAYNFPSDTICTHIVVARADYMLTQYGTRLRPFQRDSTGTWSEISAGSIASVTPANLVGARAQDLVLDVSSASVYRGVSIKTDCVVGGTAQGMILSKFYGCVAVDIGPPDLRNNLSYEDIPPDARLFQPQRSTFPYDTEKRFVLQFTDLLRSQANAFKALPYLTRWPLFLYDDAGDFIPWKLEHVLIESWNESITVANRHNLTINFRRLAHYP